MQVAKWGNSLAVRLPALFEHLRTLRGGLPPDFKFSREQANTCG